MNIDLHKMLIELTDGTVFVVPADKVEELTAILTDRDRALRAAEAQRQMHVDLDTGEVFRNGVKMTVPKYLEEEQEAKGLSISYIFCSQGSIFELTSKNKLMKKLITLLALLCLVLHVHAQKKAITDTGEEIILYKNGTWKYLNDGDAPAETVSMSSKTYKKGNDNSFLLKSNVVNMGFWIDPDVWSFKKGNGTEYDLNSKEGSIWGMIITEKIEIPLETLKPIVLQNGRKVAPDMKIVKEEYRKVNGKKVLCLQMEGTIKDVRFVYYSYYYANKNGTTQFVTYTSDALFKSSMDKMENLLNGLVER